MGAPERFIEDYLTKQANKYGFLSYKFTSPGNSGVPDRIIIGNGYTVFVELKRPGGKPRPLQIHTICRMKKRGAYVFVIDSRAAIDELLELIASASLEHDVILTSLNND